MQVAVDHPSTTSGVDVLNLATPGANPSWETLRELDQRAVSLHRTDAGGESNPIPVTGNASFGSTTISWNAPGAEVMRFIASQWGAGHHRNAGRFKRLWVPDGMTAYLQDVTARPLPDYTLATVVIHLQRAVKPLFGTDSP